MKKTPGFLQSFFLFFLLFVALAAEAGKGSVPEADALVKRVIGSRSASFVTELLDDVAGKDVFELESRKGKIFLRGNNGISIASALNYYLKNFIHGSISWNGSNLDLPAQLPQVKNRIRIVSPHTYRYYLNYCTFNYTMSWWTWERWEKEIDWMALNGINMPLAVTGQNSVWSRVYRSLGFSENELEDFFSGPAYFNWFWMGNLDGWGGPLPQSFMDRQEELQKKILARERALGMKPVLPAFTGHVPPSFAKKFPSAHLKKTTWQGFPAVSILDPGDSLFTVIGKRFMEELVNTFGTDHLYSADTFNENTPPTSDSVYLNDISKKVFQSMAEVDTASIWVMQGWMFSYSSKYWQPRQIKALLNAVPDDHMIILDLYSESKPVWNKTEAYYGKPWIWCMLHNFGGNISLYGRMNQVAHDPVAAMNDKHSGRLSGIGLTMEAIEQNPVMYELMLQHAWSSDDIDLDKWLKEYARRRYGASDVHADKTWSVLKETVYKGGITSGGPESIIVARPGFYSMQRWANPKKAYDPAKLIPALESFLQVNGSLKKKEGYQYDLVDLTRQVLANYADTLQRMFAASYAKKDTAIFKTEFHRFTSLISDLDLLLGTRKDFMLGPWLESAKAWETSPGEKGLYERNARDLITLWGDSNSVLHEYSNRQWSGLLKGFYLPRWEQFYHEVMKAARQGEDFNAKKFETEIKQWEWNWVNGRETYPVTPRGDAVALADALWHKYRKEIRSVYEIN